MVRDGPHREAQHERRLRTSHDWSSQGHWHVIGETPPQVVGDHQSEDEEDSTVPLDIHETTGTCDVMPPNMALEDGEVGRKELDDDERPEAREEPALQAEDK